MKKVSKKNEKDYDQFISSVGLLLEEARKNVYYQINHTLVKTYWEIGRKIIELEQKGKEKAEYGSALLKNISRDLKVHYGKGFSQSNVYVMRQFYLNYQKFQTVSDKLTWSHYVELLSISEDTERSFYEKQCINERWSVRELVRQKKSALFQRIALSKDKKEVLRLAEKGHVPVSVEDIVKDPYVLEFLGLREQDKYSEKELEQKIIDNLQSFLLELGKGFTFVSRQFRITLDNNHFYVDLVFYHRILKCFVLFDLKIGEVTHADVGQMNLYLNYFKKEEMTSGDNEPIGIILTKEKEKIVVEYALGGLSNKLFVSKYKLYLPDKKELEERVRKILEND